MTVIQWPDADCPSEEDSFVQSQETARGKPLNADSIVASSSSSRATRVRLVAEQDLRPRPPPSPALDLSVRSTEPGFGRAGSHPARNVQGQPVSQEEELYPESVRDEDANADLVDMLPRRQAVDAILRGPEQLTGEEYALGPSRGSTPLRSRPSSSSRRPQNQMDSAGVGGGFPSSSSSASRDASKKLGGRGVDAVPEQPSTGLSDLLMAVSMPAGSGNSIGSMPPKPTCRKCSELEANLQSLHTRHEQEMEQGRVELQERLQLCQRETLQVAAEEFRHEAEQLVQSHARQTMLSRETEEARVASLQQELQAEMAAVEGGNRWQQMALETSAQLAEAESQCEESSTRFAQAKRRAADAERKKRELEKQSGTREALRVREELARVTEERNELEKRMRGLGNRFEASKSEEARLQQRMVEESEAAVLRVHEARQESQSAEVTRVQGQLSKLRRGMQLEIGSLTSELQDAQWHQKHIQSDLAKEQKQRLEDQRKHRTAVADAQNLKAELDQVRNKLRWTESALYAQMEEKSLAELPGRLQTARRRRIEGNPGLGAGTGSASAGNLRRPNEDMLAVNEGLVAARVRRIQHSESGRPVPLPTSKDRGPVSSQSQLNLPNGLNGYDAVAADAAAGAVDSPEDASRSQGAAAGGSFACLSSDDSNGTLEPGARLLAMISRARARADQRQQLTGDAEKVKAKARELEELLSTGAPKSGIA
mmetsp:Transcript_125791/g.245294  ORF Transcript_125791/g.245294 Transcript_125791/m.245294 type:complete len:712 (+) Transcript_125791:62-2197(+)|eukprot:CAMPEP_0172668930 /NCGR_PEP_ID=MMETSP1074-20121228/9365_1 /TAXON_ID=2916 /ORGANISM="Ceratium fusus, Strain PA161109" /LENGTH=711 /DNA_ID=CAMNT_0013485643 /DNA_START=48 /DNA_END=2183 /DNA_ORIENTATION=+